MRNALLLLIMLVTVSGLARPASSSPYKQANAYYYVRDRAQLVETFTLDEIRDRPGRFAGKLVEVRGTINAVAGSDTLTTLLVGGVNGTPPVSVTLPPGKTLDDYPYMQVGSPVRLLCQVITVAGSDSGSLELSIAVPEHEAAAVDHGRAKAIQEQQQRRAAELRTRTVSPNPASRGVTGSVYRQARRLSREEVIRRYAEAVRYFNRRLSGEQARRIAGTIIDYSLKYGLDARLVMAVVAVESNFNQHAVSPVGAQGLGQLMPGTANGLGVGNAFDIEQNLEGSTRLLRNHIRNMTADGRPTDEAIKLALACYNAGAGAVKKYKGIPPYRETRNYVKKITRLYRQFCGYEG